jgi:hypothetical protein
MQINCMKLPLIYTDLFFKQVFENATPRNPSPRRCRQREFPVTASADCSRSASSRSRSVTCDARFTGGRLRQLKHTH